MDAAACPIEKAIVANPTYAEAYNDLGVLYRDAGDITLSIESYEQCLKIDVDSRNAGQQTFMKVSYFIEVPLIYHDFANYKVVVYSAVVQADAKTNRFRDRLLRKGGTWRDIQGVDEKKVASMVREDKADILVELTGRTANNKLGMMGCKPAPV